VKQIDAKRQWSSLAAPADFESGCFAALAHEQEGEYLFSEGKKKSVS